MNLNFLATITIPLLLISKSVSGDFTALINDLATAVVILGCRGLTSIGKSEGRSLKLTYAKYVVTPF